MRFRSLGRTGWQVSEIGFGGWQIGGDWGPVNDADSIETLLYAFERGVNFVDTAELYGNGHSEEVIGAALKQWRGPKIYVATKARPVVWPDPDDDAPQMRGRFAPWYLRAKVEGSLRRLGVERLDLFQIHSWGPSGIEELDWLETLNALRSEGKIDRIGVSLRDYRPDEGLALAAYGLVDTIQVIYNIFEQRTAARLFPAGAASGTGFIARVPLDSGALSGTWTKDSYASFFPGSQPHNMFRGTRFGETLERAEALNVLCQDYYPTLAEAALRFVLAAPEVSTLIPGMRNRVEVDLNVAYSDGKHFPGGLRSALASHGWIRNYYQ